PRVGQLTPNDVKRWDLGAIQKVFETANGRANTLQALGENLQQVHNVLSGWQGEAGEAFRADLGKARRDIEADGQESRQVAAAVARAEGDVRACKRELEDIERAAEANGWTITPDWRIDVGDTWIGRDPIEFAAQQQLLQDQLIALNVHAHSADHELATAVRFAVGEVPLDTGGHAPSGGAPPQGPPNPAAER
ncbi:WXG100 family type VII secretion target, partial [Mycobacterium kansasii]